MKKEDLKGNVIASNLKMIYEIFKYQKTQSYSHGYSFDINQIYELVNVKFTDVYLNLIEMICLKHFVSSFKIKNITSDYYELESSEFINRYPDIRDGFVALSTKVKYFNESTFYNPISSIIYVVDFEFTGQKILNLLSYKGEQILNNIYANEEIGDSLVSDILKNAFVDNFSKVCFDYHMKYDVAVQDTFHKFIYNYMEEKKNLYEIDSDSFYRMCLVLPKYCNQTLDFNTFNSLILSVSIENILKKKDGIPSNEEYEFIFSLKTNLSLFMAMYLYSDVIINFEPLIYVEKELNRLSKELTKTPGTDLSILSMNTCINAIEVAEDSKDLVHDSNKVLLIPGFAMINYTIKIPVKIETTFESMIVYNPIDTWLSDSKNEILKSFGEKKLNSLKKTIEGVLSCL